MSWCLRNLAVIGACLQAGGAPAAVLGSSAEGFTIREQVEFAGPPAAAWKHLIDIGSWWDPEHTYSGRSSNLTLTLRPGGCWCEKLDKDGFVRHLDVVLVIPEKTLRLTGGLGPLQGMGATGALTFTLRGTSATVTTVIAEYSVVGYSREGLSSVAGAVDQVLGEQLRRFAGG